MPNDGRNAVVYREDAVQPISANPTTQAPEKTTPRIDAVQGVVDRILQEVVGGGTPTQRQAALEELFAYLERIGKTAVQALGHDGGPKGLAYLDAELRPLAYDPPLAAVLVRWRDFYARAQAQGGELRSSGTLVLKYDADVGSTMERYGVQAGGGWQAEFRYASPSLRSLGRETGFTQLSTIVSGLVHALGPSSGALLDVDLRDLKPQQQDWARAALAGVAAAGIHLRFLETSPTAWGAGMQARAKVETRISELLALGRPMSAEEAAELRVLIARSHELSAKGY